MAVTHHRFDEMNDDGFDEFMLTLGQWEEPGIPRQLVLVMANLDLTEARKSGGYKARYFAQVHVDFAIKYEETCISLGEKPPHEEVLLSLLKDSLRDYVAGLSEAINERNKMKLRLYECSREAIKSLIKEIGEKIDPPF